MKNIIYIFLISVLSLAQLNGSSLRIEADQLSKNLDNHTILDTRKNEVFLQGHIKGALNFPIDLTYEHKKTNGKVTQPIKMQKIIRDLGLNINDSVVVYDDGTFFDAARLFWTLEVYGFTNVKLLNAGYKQWTHYKYPTSKKIRKVKKSDYIASINNKRLATKFSTQIATKNPNQFIIDARGHNAYIGLESSAKRFGHIPKAIHIPAAHNINYDAKVVKLKSSKKLGELYKDIKKDKKVVIYCAIGRIATTNYFALRELGYDVANYDASWKEWGNDFNLPINNPSEN